MQEEPRIVIAGQAPPPFGGQTVMIGRLVEAMAGRPGVRNEHWAFHFTRNTGEARKPGVGKLVELASVLWSLLKLRLAGAIDLMIYPAGGPQFVPVVRDLCLLPWALLATRRLVIHFHAGGIAEGLPSLPAPIRWALKWLCHQADAALVMTEFGRRDPLSLGITNVVSVPHTIEDRCDVALLQRGKGSLRLLYVGHLCPDKGTPALLEAFAALRASGVDARLDLVGECLAPFTDADLRALLKTLGIKEDVERPGVLRGAAKWDRFARADLFVFPSVASYESFGLVTAEAMMWSLPVVISDWRGNREVLGEPPGGIVYQPPSGLADALADACARRDEWPKWGQMNRAVYEARFKAETHPDRLPRAVEAFLDL